jgi:acyl-CoA thioester hydrolase
MSIIHEQSYRIKESHLDTFGHVNNAAYLTILEDARWDIISQRGFGLAEIQNLQVGPTILEVTLRFRAELRNREEVLIRTWATGQVRKVIQLRQVIINSAGREACEADFVMGMFDMKARKLIEPTPEFKAAIGID